MLYRDLAREDLDAIFSDWFLPGLRLRFHPGLRMHIIHKVTPKNTPVHPERQTTIIAPVKAAVPGH